MKRSNITALFPVISPLLALALLTPACGGGSDGVGNGDGSSDDSKSDSKSDGDSGDKSDATGSDTGASDGGSNTGSNDNGSDSTGSDNSDSTGNDSGSDTGSDSGSDTGTETNTDIPDGDDGVGPNKKAHECKSSSDAGKFTFVEIPTWRDGAKAAYSMVHDDLCGPALDGIFNNAVPALAKRSLSAVVGPFVEACDDRDYWENLDKAAAAGIEIGNHSFTHANVTADNAAKEVKDAKTEFDKKLKSPVTFFIFPYDYFNADTIKAVGDAGHIGARSGSRDDNDGFDNPPINPATIPAGDADGSDFKLEFDVWPRTYSKYALYYPFDILTVHAYNAMERGGWAVREFHSVSASDTPGNDEGFGPISLKDYEKHLDFLISAWIRNDLWTAGPSEIIRYRHARDTCKASVSGDKITFDVNSDCEKWHTPLSVIVTTDKDVTSVGATQDGKPVWSRKIASKKFSITADPTLGDVELTGCEEQGPEVRSNESLDAKPSAVDSVCEIVTVKGKGDDGMMDSLERPAEEFQILPNPEQKDGRDGSWSWYPQNVTVEMKDKALHYASDKAINAWTGTTLAFLGGNGAGACYDGSAYQGIKFKIKGTVSGGGDGINENQLVVSIITAETQTRKFGGDLNGEGGHFNKIIDLTADWTEVSIAWADLKTPTWGETSNLTAVAKAKLQAIDWGISDKATKWDVWIDDIQMY